MTRDEVGIVLATLKAAWPRQEITPEMVSLWSELLRDLDATQVMDAAKRICLTATFFPSLGQLRKEATRDGADRAGLEAWGDVKTAIVRYGRYRQPRFDDPYVARAIDALGWEALCDSDRSMEASWRARFVELYEHNQSRVATQRQLGSVAPDAPVRVSRGVESGNFARRLLGDGDEGI